MKVTPTHTAEEMLEREAFFRSAANRIVDQARKVIARGDGWGDRKAFIADVSKDLGIPVQRLGPMLIMFNQLGWVPLSRADLVGAMDPAKVASSEIEDARHLSGPHDRGPSYHFIVPSEARNPAWINQALTINIEELTRNFPVEWLPKIVDPHMTKKGEMAVDFDTLGCGNYGCVLETYDEKVVMKITTDSSEVEFVIMATEWGWPPGITFYYGYHEIDGRYRIKPKFPMMDAAVLFRESARLVGKLNSDNKLDIDDVHGVDARAEAVRLIESAYESGTAALIAMFEKVTAEQRVPLYRQAKRLKERGLQIVKYYDPLLQDYWGQILIELNENNASADLRLAAAIEGYRRVAEAMKKNEPMKHAGETLLFYLRHDVIISDLHAGNFGVVERDGQPTWAITDPGNVIVLPEPWD